MGERMKANKPKEKVLARGEISEYGIEYDRKYLKVRINRMISHFNIGVRVKVVEDEMS